MRKNTILKVVGAMIAGLILGGAVYVGYSWYTKGPASVAFLTSLLPSAWIPKPNSPETAPIQKNLGIEKRTSVDNTSTLYILTGHFANGIQNENGIIRGDFLIDGDATKILIPVILGDENATVNLVTYTSSFSEVGKWEAVTSESLVSTISKSTRVKLSVYTYPEQAKDSSSMSLLIQNLDEFASGRVYSSPRLVLDPRETGIIK